MDLFSQKNRYKTKSPWQPDIGRHLQNRNVELMLSRRVKFAHQTMLRDLCRKRKILD
jgi:hypothetical protein